MQTQTPGPLSPGDLDFSVLGPLRADSRHGVEFRLFWAGSGSYWLLSDGKPGRSAAAYLYSPQRPAGEALRLWMRLGGPPQARLFLNRDALEQLQRVVADALGIANPILSFAAGPPRPANKLIAAIMDGAGRPHAFAKMAPRGAARELLSLEADALTRLAGIGSLRSSLPRILGRMESTGFEILLLAPGPVSRGPRRAGEAHLHFLAELQEATSEEGTVAELRQFGEALRLLNKARAVLRPPELERYERVLDVLRSELGSSPLHASVAHGDFVPWNTRSGSSALWVLDWESARAGTLGGFDAFHFEFVPAALKGRGEPAPALPLALLDRTWPEGRELVPLLRLAYLMSLSLQYCHDLGQSGRSRRNPILARAWASLDKLLQPYGK